MVWKVLKDGSGLVSNWFGYKCMLVYELRRIDSGSRWLSDSFRLDARITTNWKVCSVQPQIDSDCTSDWKRLKFGFRFIANWTWCRYKNWEGLKYLSKWYSVSFRSSLEYTHGLSGFKTRIGLDADSGIIWNKVVQKYSVLHSSLKKHIYCGLRELLKHFILHFAIESTAVISSDA